MERDYRGGAPSPACFFGRAARLTAAGKHALSGEVIEECSGGEPMCFSRPMVVVETAEDRPSVSHAGEHRQRVHDTDASFATVFADYLVISPLLGLKAAVALLRVDQENNQLDLP